MSNCTEIQQDATWFQGRRTPAETGLVGLSALVDNFKVKAPVRRPACVSRRYVRGSVKEADGWRIFDKRYNPGNTIGAHLAFALRHEDLDLLVLKRIFEAVPPEEVATFVRSAPNGEGSRRIWYWYEHLTGEQLALADAPSVTAVDLLDAKRYFTSPGVYSRRHRVNDNMLGTPAFNPIIRRTSALESFVAQDISRQAHEAIGRFSKQMVRRAASFLLLADSKASFAIENERPPSDRLESWGRALLEAGKRPLGLTELERLQGLLFGDDRFVRIGLRSDGVYLGERDREGKPLPEFIGARPDHLLSLMEGLFACGERMGKGRVDAVLHAAAIAFGFVYIHPLEDGNGRIHRCLIHQVLAERMFGPTGLVFPVSSVMADRLEAYKTTLENHSAALMSYIDWQPTPERNVEVLNDTADLYRYYDCTEEAEFLYGCVARTVTFDLPNEIDYLRRHDEAMKQVKDRVALSDRLAADFIMFVRQNLGTLAKRRRTAEFARLTQAEVEELEAIVNLAFANFVGQP
jgi:hypothetical protein